MLRRSNIESETRSIHAEYGSKLLPYPIDMSSYLALPLCTLDPAGIPYHGSAPRYHPTTIAQYALAHWNHYLAANDEYHLHMFVVQAHWFVEHAISIGETSVGWPISLPHPDVQTRGLWLSALAQGSVLSVLVRAYQLTHKDVFLTLAARAIRTFEHDILDGGVSTPIGIDGVYFEEVAVYPAAHALSGFIFALFGLHDYVSLTGDAQIEALISRSLVTMHSFLEEFDVGFWTRCDLLSRRLTSPSELALQVTLLETLARYSACEHCSAVASRWKGYQRRLGSRLHYLFASRCASLRHLLWSQARTALFPCPQASDTVRVCIPLTAFPFTGGVLTVLQGITQVMKERWHVEYMAQIIGPGAAEYTLHSFGTAKMAPWHFPLVWLHTLAGASRLVSLLRHGAQYQVIMPQDALFTAAFCSLVGRLAGIRVVCMDHSTLTWPTNRLFRAERIAAVRRKHWPWTFQQFVLLMLKLYWPSLSLLARVSARFVDHFLIPGIPGDEVGEVCNRLGIQPNRLTRFASMIDIQRHTVFDVKSRARMREKKKIAPDAIVISIICRLEAEKGLEVAAESIHQALSACSPETSTRVRVVIAGDGLFRRQLEEDIQRLELSQNCVFWGDIPAEEVITLLGISDIFLYTSTRGACIPMSVLEAMASGCAVIASTQPMANAHLLAEGRGIAVPPEEAEQTARALVRLVNDLELCHRMGELARHYIALHHSPALFRRTLLRVTCWSALNELLDSGGKTGVVEKEIGGRP